MSRSAELRRSWLRRSGVAALVVVVVAIVSPNGPVPPRRSSPRLATSQERPALGPVETGRAIGAAPGRAGETAPAWPSLVQEALAEREYEATQSSEGLQAPNRAQNLRTYFDEAGIRLHEREATADSELLRLSLKALGRGDRLLDVDAGTEVIARGGRVEIVRPGLVEWYENSPHGLEQGFTLSARPDRSIPDATGAEPSTALAGAAGFGAPRAEALVLELAVARARAELFGDAVHLVTNSGRTLAYRGLHVVDADGDALASRFEVPSGDRIRLVVDDAAASYPIVIDPLITETADARIESNQANAQLGTSVASAGDVNGDGYDDVIVGAPGYDAGQPDEGAAFIFLGGATGIATGGPAAAATVLEGNQATVGFTDGAPQFGTSVASAGDVNGDGYDDVIVGAPLYDAGQLDEGAAFIFHGGPTGIPNGGPASAATRLESNVAANPLFPFVPATRFGQSVAGAGDVNGDGYADVVVGAPEFSAGQSQEGAAFVFLGSASGVANGDPATASAQLESNVVQSNFGAAVAGAGDLDGDGYDDVVVGDDSYLGRGAAFVFPGSAAGIADAGPGSPGVTEIVSTQVGSAFGASVAGAGDVDGDGRADLIVGAPTYDADQTDEGAAFVFRGHASGIPDSDEFAGARLVSGQAGARYGQSVAGVGDVNGDGRGDIAVGAHQYDSGQTNEGAAFVYLGNSTTGPGGVATFTRLALLESNQAEAWLGWSVAGAGDVDGDGRADVIAGAYLYDADQSNEGAAFVYHTGGPVGERFEGVSLFEATALPGIDANPPAPSLAVGRTQLFQTTNGAYAVLDKETGTVVQLISPEAFWQNAGQAVYWPYMARVFYHDEAERWVAAALAQRSAASPENEVLIAVSDTDDALGTWKASSVTGPATPDLYLTDLTLSLDRNAVYVGTNRFDLDDPNSIFGPSFSGTRLYVIPVDSLLAAPAPSTTNMRQLDLDFVSGSTDSGFLPVGVRSRRTDQTGVVVAMSANLEPNFAFSLTGLTPSSAIGSTLGPSVYGSPLSPASLILEPARQPALAVPENRRIVDTIDPRIGSGVESQGHIYTIQTISVDVGGGEKETRLRWNVLDADTLEPMAHGEIGTPGYDSYLGSLAVNAFGEVVVTYNRSGLDPATGNISHMAQIFETGGDGSLVPVSGEMLLRTSPTDDYHTGSPYGAPASGRQRWGTHSEVVLDPDDPTRFYVIAPFAREYNSPQFGHPNGTGASRWGTSIAVIRVPEPGVRALLLFGFAALAAFARRRRLERDGRNQSPSIAAARGS